MMDRTFKFGDSGDSVFELQAWLNKALPEEVPLVIDGIFGRKTERSVRIFQREVGRPVSGEVDNETLKALKAVNFKGQLVIEAFGQGLPALAAATKIWRKMFKDEETLAKEGLAFMKKSWGGAAKAAKPAPKAKTSRKLVKAGRK